MQASPWLEDAFSCSVWAKGRQTKTPAALFLEKIAALLCLVCLNAPQPMRNISSISKLEQENPAAARIDCLRDNLLLGALGLLAMTAGLWRGLLEDEYITWSRCRLPVADLVEDRLRNGHFPTYFLLTRMWGGVVGDSEIALRLPSLFMAVAAILVFRTVMGELFGRRTANTASIIFSLHQVVLWSGQMARPYAGMLLFGMLAALGIVRWWHGRGARWLVLTSVAVASGFLFQAAFALTPVAFALALLPALRKTPRCALTAAAALLLPLLLLTVPALTLARSQEKFQDVTTKPKKLKLGGVASALGNVAFGTIDSWAGNGWRYPAVLLFTGTAVAAARSRKRERDWPERLPPPVPASGSADDGFPRHALIWSWCFTPVLALVVSQALTGGSILSHERYFVPCLGGMVALIAVGVQAMSRQPWMSRAPAVPFALVFTAVLLNAAAFWSSDGDGPRRAAWMMNASQTFVPVICNNTVPLEYEYRKFTPPLLKLRPSKAQETEKELVRLAAGKPFWLFIYNNKKDPLDPFLERPPVGYSIGQRVEIRYARAALMFPAGSGNGD